MRNSAYLLLLFMLLAGCTTFVKDPVVTVKSLDVVSLDGAGAGLELSLCVENPNRFDVGLLGYSYDLRIMALPLAKGAAREEITFASRAATDLRIPIRISYGDLLEIFRRKPDLDNIPYRLSAGLDLRTPLGRMNVPVRSDGSYAMPKQYRPSLLLNKITDFFQMNR